MPLTTSEIKAMLVNTMIMRTTFGGVTEREDTVQRLQMQEELTRCATEAGACYVGGEFQWENWTIVGIGVLDSDTPRFLSKLLLKVTQ